MHLEILVRTPATRSPRAPVVFVHGSWHGAWCWDEHFLDFFSERGHPAYAFDLRGHGGSDGRDRLRWTRLADYVADLERVVGTLGIDPVLVGHSMGGAVVQKYLETHRAPAAVLMGSLPPAGAVRAMLRLAGRHPLAVLKTVLTLRLRHLVITPELAREAFFSEDLPTERFRDYFSRLQEESFRVFLDMLALDLPRPAKVTTPVLVVAAERDTFFTRREMQATARAYGAELASFPMAHNMMLEPGWQTVAGHVINWLRRIVGTVAAPPASKGA